MKILTISIAAYNVEKYLEDALNSLCDLRYVNDLEILVIDDGSQDNTKSVAKKYESKFPLSVKYVEKQNGGHGSTINKGMELASGKYFRILDGDDYVDPDSFNQFLSKLKKIETDVVISNYCWVDDNHNKYIHNHKIFNNTQVNTEISYDSSIYDSSLFGLSTLTIKTELLKRANVKITEKCFYVDVEFIIWSIYLSNVFVYFDDKVYMYRCIVNGKNSTSKSNLVKNVNMQKKVALHLCELYESFVASDITLKKKNIIQDRVKMSIGSCIRTYLLLENCSISKQNIIKFDSDLKAISKSMYNFTNKELFFRCIRSFDYFFVFFIRYIYKIYIHYFSK